MAVFQLLQISFFLIVSVIVVTAAFPGAGACDANANSSCAANVDVVTIVEEREASASRVELLQNQVRRTRSSLPMNATDGMVSPKSGADAKATQLAQEASQKDSAESVSSLVSKDHNDKLCMLCGKPLPERVNKVYTEHRKDCGGMSSPQGPNASTLSAPAMKLTQLGEDGTENNGFCQLNFAKSCVDAVANKDYLYWAKSVDLNSTSARANAGFDGRYCRINGFLEPSLVGLQHDFHATQAKARELCKTKYAKYNLDNISFVDMMKAARYDDAAAPTLHEAELLAAWNCAMGDLGCDLSLCAYSFCATESGTGLYDECKGWHPVHGMPTL